MKRLFPALAGLAAAICGISTAAGSRESDPAVASRIELGRRLFYEADLSINGTMSCATCHEQKHGFADGNRTHPGALDDPGRRNVPGLANVGRFARLTWADPALTSLEAQIAVPVFGEHPVEMGMKGHEADIPARLGHDACYVRMFRQAFPEGDGRISYDNVARAIAAFERSLVSRNAPYDRFVGGDAEVISPNARTGLTIFRNTCASCHAGPDLTDTAYHRIVPAHGASGNDAGLSEVTGNSADDHKFRTPGLRNLGVTAPYLHDGSAESVADAIRAHDDFATLPEADLDALAVFLDTLTDRDFLTDPRFALPAQACGQPL
ncbi:cytochrome-c peroxidase [Novosphingobium mangrovi (ex Huang et al. 2023)]|uniref:Cytochrome-c peroxidase n=1 Tax=Novosphingobium mangrovi (ex Huang et al. 2023) TaxID=2976432 RepID=A0ABT2I0J3_9SPHN|nr:cytochrome c peroxidase [Novosphingobium mangrovi (ex Huang et al. 2023)]MCT2398319.1 cytochrome-c peroxidase [Novosphingobium mangrovi (ex Huang et al. 2023)]